MVNKDLIQRKLTRLVMYIEKLEPIAIRNEEDYLEDDYLKYSTERLIQLIVECASDINNHVVVKLNKKPPEDYAVSFVAAAKVGLITGELANELKGSAGMRNILVHEYMDINDSLVFEILPKAIKLYREYVKQVNQFISK